MRHSNLIPGYLDFCVFGNQKKGPEPIMLLPIFPNFLLLPSNVYLVQVVEADF